jgi:hypothetical protein
MVLAAWLIQSTYREVDSKWPVGNVLMAMRIGQRAGTDAAVSFLNNGPMNWFGDLTRRSFAWGEMPYEQMAGGLAFPMLE